MDRIDGADKMNKMVRHKMTRREFVKRAVAGAALVGLPAIVPATALGQGGRAAPSERITVGVIGLGRGKGVMGGVANQPDAQVLAVCDVDRNRRESTKRAVDLQYDWEPEKGCGSYNDFRDMYARGDLDAMIVGSPDHWHAILSIQAVRAGMDVYCEKPMTLTIREGQEMVKAVRRYGRVFQTGSQQRSEYGGKFRFACELVRNGYIGEVKRIYVGVGGPSGECHLPEEPVPEWMDWEMWLGPAPWRPYNKGLHPGTWRAYRDYSGGGMTDWGAHHFDIAQWALDMDESGPVEIYPPGEEYPVLTYRYATGVIMHHMFGPGSSQIKLPSGQRVNGLLIEGDEGWVEVSRNHIRTSPETLVKQTIGPDEVHLYESPGHSRDWLNCIKSRRRPICDVAIGHRSVSVCHLGNLAYWLNRPLKWDPVKEEFPGDEAANRWLDRPKRAPWTL